jgi:hypothetical protein
VQYRGPSGAETELAGFSDMTRATSALIAALFAVSIFAGPVSADALGDCTNAHDTDAAISGCSQIIEGGLNQ